MVADFLVKVALVAFDAEDVVAAFFNDFVGDLALGAHGVDGDDGTLEVEHFQQFGDGGDLVAFVADEALGEGDAPGAGPGAHGMNVAFATVTATTQRFAVDGDLFVGEDDSGLLEMVDDALAEEFGIDGFKDAGEGVVAWDAVGEGDPFAEPFEPDFAELLHEFVGFDAAEDAGVGDEDDFAEVVEVVAAVARVLDHLKGTETSGEALRLIGFVGISGHPSSVKPLDAVVQIYMLLGIDSLPSVGTLRENPARGSILGRLWSVVTQCCWNWCHSANRSRLAATVHCLTSQ